MKGQKGITLIALIITIVVMLILVGVAVSTAINSNIFNDTRAAKDNWVAAEGTESNLDVDFDELAADPVVPGGEGEGT